MHRTCSPQETISQIEPYFEKIGLTRLADITGLDRIGIPVILSIRPNSTFLAVDAGKGITPEAATASAAMECIERYHAESVFLDHFSMPYSQLSTEYNAIPVENLPLARCALFNTDHPEQWSLGWDLMGQCEIPVPFLMVTATRNRCRLSDMISFQVGSTGLASGNHFLEAVYSGLCEVIERDAVTCNMVAAQAGAYKIPRVILDTIEYPLVVEQLTHLERANVKPIIVDCTIDTEVPTYMVIIYDLESRNIGLYAGYGTSLDPEIAMTRAITEACQSRLISISGSRDDFFRSHFNSLKENDDKRVIAIIEAEPATIDARYNKACNSSAFFRVFCD